MKIALALFAIALFAASNGYANLSAHCENELVMNASTKQLASYLSVLVDRGIIGDEKLIWFLAQLENGKIDNPISAGVSSSALMIHRGRLAKLLLTSDLDVPSLRDWTSAVLEKRGVVRENRETAKETTHEIHYPMVFKTIKPGKYWHYDKLRELTHPFEMMTTPVTQKMWVELMGENPAEFSKGENGATTLIDGRTVYLQPDNPIENLTWWSVLVFANKLSIAHGLEPVYDLTGAKFLKGTRAENGSLLLEENHEDFVPRIQAPEGDIYRAPGYRLPTNAELSYLRLRENIGPDGNLFFGLEGMNVAFSLYAWSAKNSDMRTHPVAQLNPFLIDGNKFFDLLGNVAEMQHDDFETKALVNPVGRMTPTVINIRGEGYALRHDDLYTDANRSRGKMSGFHPTGLNTGRFGSIGFRLVRSVE